MEGGVVKNFKPVGERGGESFTPASEMTAPIAAPQPWETQWQRTRREDLEATVRRIVVEELDKREARFGEQVASAMNRINRRGV